MHIKKAILITLITALLFSISAPAVFAQSPSEISADVQSCINIGMLYGPSDGVTYAYTQSEPTRIQAALMLLRLKGLEETAKAYKGTDNFSDVYNSFWKPITAYLKAHPEFGFDGTGNNTFSPNAKMTAQQYYKVLLNVLGYKVKVNTSSQGDFLFADTIKFSSSIGLNKVAGVNKFTIENLATATLECLKADLKGGTKTLATSLVDSGVLDKNKAQAAGVYQSEKNLLVNSVEAINANLIKVTFNMPVDKASAENMANYILTSGDNILCPINFSGVWKGDPSVTLQGDGKTVLIVLDTLVLPAQNLSSHTDMLINDKESFLVVENVLSSDKSQTLVKSTSSFYCRDANSPTVTDVKLIGNKILQIKFSEDVIGADSLIAYKFNGSLFGNYVMHGWSYDRKNNIVTFNFERPLPIGTSYLSVQDNCITDWAGLAVKSQNIPVVVSNDTTAAAISSAIVDSNKSYIDIIFTKPIAYTTDYSGSPLFIDDVAVFGNNSPGFTLSVNNGILRIQPGKTVDQITAFNKLIETGAHRVNISNDTSNYLVDAFDAKVQKSSGAYIVK